MNLLFSVANNKAFIVSLQIPYELFLEKFYKSKEAIHTDLHSYYLPKASPLLVRCDTVNCDWPNYSKG